LFPSFAPWAGHDTVINYRHRPNGDDLESCIMDIDLLTLYLGGIEPPADARSLRLGIDQPFSDAAEVLGTGLAKAFSQGERIRHFYQTMDKYINGSIG